VPDCRHADQKCSVEANGCDPRRSQVNVSAEKAAAQERGESSESKKPPAMSDKTWIDVCITLIAALPAVIAAASSLKNGRTLRNGGPRPKLRVNRPGPEAKRKGQKAPDWYRGPGL